MIEVFNHPEACKCRSFAHLFLTACCQADAPHGLAARKWYKVLQDKLSHRLDYNKVDWSELLEGYDAGVGELRLYSYLFECACF